MQLGARVKTAEKDDARKAFARIIRMVTAWPCPPYWAGRTADGRAGGVDNAVTLAAAAR